MHLQPKKIEEEKIRRIAFSIYQETKDLGLKDDPKENWTKAETLFRNKLKYRVWSLGNWVRVWHHQIVAVVAIFALISNVLMMTWNIGTNAWSTDLNTRPYVSVNIQEPLIYRRTDKDMFYGNDFVLKNTGRIPAAKVSTSYYVTTDFDKDNRSGEKWFIEQLGGYGGVSFITSQATEREPGLRSVSPASPNYYYWEALTTYEGLDYGKKYWTHVKKIYFANEPANQFIPVLNIGEWDRN